MKNNKGFTLIELLGVVVILAAVALIAFPAIVNQIKKSNSDLDSALNKVIFTASEQLLYEMNYPKTNTYCIQLKELVDEGKLTAPIRDSSGNEVSLGQYFVINYSNGENSLVQCIGAKEGCEHNCSVIIPNVVGE